MSARSVLLFLLVGLLALPLAAGEPPHPPPGMGEYVMVLKGPAAVPPGQVKPNPGKKIVEPDLTKFGGRLLHSHENERLILLPPGQAKHLRDDENVAYLQRIWFGEPPEDLAEAASADPQPRLTTNTDPETDLTWQSGNYLYDHSGNIKQIKTDTYRYDAANRLIAATVNGTPVTYAYDSFGNLMSTTVGSQPAAVTQVDSTSNRVANEPYDAAGNVLANGYTSYYYDSVGMMSGIVSQFGQSKRMIYTADDERIGVYIDSASNWTIRDFDGKVLTQFTAPGDNYWKWDQDFVYADGRIVGGAREAYYGGTRHYHLDHLGSVRMVTDNSRTRLGLHDYYPFGVEQTAMNQEDTNFGHERPDPMKFTGHQRDFLGPWNWDNTDYLDYMHARYYNPSMGRFLSVDPVLDVEKAVREPQRWNRYAYVLNNPVKLIDPDGRDVVYADDYSRKAVEATRQISPGTDAVVTAFEQDSTRVLRFAEGDAPDIGGGLRIGETRTRKESDPNAKPREFIVILDKKDIDKTKADKRFVVIHEVVGHVKPNSERAMKDQGTAQQREKAAQQRTAEEIRKIPQKSRPRVPRDQEQP